MVVENYCLLIIEIKTLGNVYSCAVYLKYTRFISRRRRSNANGGIGYVPRVCSLSVGMAYRHQTGAGRVVKVPL